MGRRPPRRLAAVGPRPARPRRPRPRRRPAAHRGQRGAPGPRRHDQVAAPPQHRAQRRPQRRRDPARARPRLAAARRGGACCRGRSTWRPGPTRWPARSDGPLARSSVAGGPARPTRRAAARDPAITAGLLAIEGAHALDGDPANVEVVADAGFRMMSPSHFFDNAFGGSAHGVEKGGLTDAGREMVAADGGARRCWSTSRTRRPRRSTTSWRWPRRPVVASHTGVRGVADNARNLSDEHLRGDRRDRRPHRDRVLADGLRRRRRRLRSRARSATPSTSPASSTSASAPTSTAPCPRRSTRPGSSS